MDEQTLRQRLEEIDSIGDQHWLNALTPRGKAELDFHNKQRDPLTGEHAVQSQDTYEKFYGNRKYYTTTKRSHDYLEEWIAKHAPGAIFLDYACGHGGSTRMAARYGAKLAIGIDISDVSIKNARELARKENLSANTYFVQGNAENTMLPDECVDVAMCSGVLHHLDLSYAFPELRRILKVGGRALASEALDYNPAIKLYRALTPQMRTEWEKAHILSHRDLAFARRFFDVGEVRYWHVLGYIGGAIPAVRAPLDMVDRLLEKIPLLQLMSWIWTFELIRPPKA
jgi:ubiquinone/menaquinone biosynthesis C-methylase UbiE